MKDQIMVDEKDFILRKMILELLHPWIKVVAPKTASQLGQVVPRDVPRDILSRYHHVANITICPRQGIFHHLYQLDSYTTGKESISDNPLGGPYYPATQPL